MLHALYLALLVVACVLAVPVLVVSIQVLSAGRRDRVPATITTALRPTRVVLVPAHNEELGIAATIKNLRSQLQSGDRLLIVADNCSDGTAIVAQGAGAEVVVRHDPDRRGKGYALDFGIRSLAHAAPEVLVIVDADCTVTPGAIDTLVSTCAAHHRPVQGLYLMRSPPGAGLGARIGELAWILRNRVRPLGWWRLGWPCQLMGSGMAFPFAQLQAMPLASGEIVEDLRLGLDLAAKGSPPLFCPSAEVHSVFPVRGEDLQTQRRRWEMGHLSLLFSCAPHLLRLAVQKRQLGLAAMALDLAVPPLALLVLCLGATAVCGLLIGFFTQGWWPATIAAAALALLAGAVVQTWRWHGREIVTLPELCSAPLYALAKLPIYAAWVLRRTTTWQRTGRDPVTSAAPKDSSGRENPP